jgi:ferritin-like metal-binding protein YciE
MFERLHTPSEAYNYKLGAALQMEEKVLDILDANIEHAQDEQLKALFRHHREETEQQIHNLRGVFQAFGWEVDDSPCPAIQGIEKEGKSNVRKAEDAVVDSVILQGAVETEHHEIGVYENLIIHAEAMGKPDAVRLLKENLEQEQHTLEEVKRAEQQLAMAATA